MNGLIAQLLAALAALSALTGSPADANKLPDRPAIVQSVPASTKNVVSNSASTKPSDNASKSVDNSSKLNRVEIQGTIASIKKSGATTTITVGDQTITLDAKTKVEGKLEVGAKVQIEAFKQANGTLIASQVESKTVDTTIKPSDDKSSTSKSKSGEVKKDDSSSSNGSGEKSDSKSDSGSGDDKTKTETESESGDDHSGSGSGKSGSGSNEGSGHH